MTCGGFEGFFFCIFIIKIAIDAILTRVTTKKTEIMPINTFPSELAGSLLLSPSSSIGSVGLSSVISFEVTGRIVVESCDTTVVVTWLTVTCFSKDFIKVDSILPLTETISIYHLKRTLLEM